MKFQVLWGAVLLLALGGLHGAAAAECGPLKLTNTVQMLRESRGDRDSIPLQINGKDLQFLLTPAASPP